MSTTTEAAKAIEEINRSATMHTNERRMARTMPPGKHLRQGDVYIIALAREPTHGKVTTDRQLAEGTTKGSRHIAEGELTLYEPSGGDRLAGPVIHARERWNLAHPEHADFSIPSGWYQCRFQRDFGMEEIERVRD